MRGIAGSWLVSGDEADAPIVRGAVLLDGEGCVVAAGEAEALRRAHPSARWEEVRAVLLPGLVNAHTHLELSALRGQVAGGRGFVPWIENMLEARARLEPEKDAEAIEAGVSELLAAGTAAVGEVSNTLAALPALASAPLLACVFHEIFAMRKDTGEAMIGMAAQQRAELGELPEHVCCTPAPHTPYSLHPEILQRIVAEARGLGRPTSLHLCEHTAERAYLADGGGPFGAFVQARGSSPVDWAAPGKDPIRYAASLGVLGPDMLCVHLTDARPDEIALLAETGARVVLCPRSNLHIEVKLPPLLEMRKAGLRPGLGTDSLASNASLDVLDEARALGERFPSVAPRSLLAMATSGGADALGLSARVGRLRPGLSPGVIAFEHGAAAPGDPERFVLSRAPLRRTVLARPNLAQVRPRPEPDRRSA